MKRFKSARGGISFGGILSLAFFAFLVYEAFQFGPILIAQYQFKDEMLDAAKFSRGKKAQAIKDNLATKAGELALPIRSNQIQVTMQAYNTRIQVTYQQNVEWLPGSIYTWQVEENIESPVF